MLLWMEAFAGELGNVKNPKYGIVSCGVCGAEERQNRAVMVLKILGREMSGRCRVSQRTWEFYRASNMHICMCVYIYIYVYSYLFGMLQGTTGCAGKLLSGLKNCYHYHTYSWRHCFATG